MRGRDFSGADKELSGDEVDGKAEMEEQGHLQEDVVESAVAKLRHVVGYFQVCEVESNGFKERGDEGHGEMQAVAHSESGQSMRNGAEIEEGSVAESAGYVEVLEGAWPGMVKSIGFGVVC